MGIETEKYEPFGTQWEKEMNNISKKTLVKMYREIALGNKVYNELLQELKARKQSHKEMEAIFKGGEEKYWQGRKDEANFIIEKINYSSDNN